MLLAKELADPRIGFVTITDVETAPDLRHAKVWVSVIGGKADQKETLRALQHSMGFIRHELGRTLRIKRIPALHVHLDDTAERGTRVLHLLQELEEGKEPETIAPYEESLPKPVQRLPHEGDAETEGFGGRRGRPRRCHRRRFEARAPADHPPRARRPAGGAWRTAQDAPSRPEAHMTDAIDLTALARDAVPAPVLARLTAARNALVVSHENPDADTLGAGLGVCAILEACGGSRDRGLHGPGPAAVRVPRGRRAVPHGPGSRRDVRPAGPRRLRLGGPRRGGRPAAPRAVRHAAAGDHRPPRLERRRRRGGLDRAGLGRDVRDGDAPRGAARRPARHRRRHARRGADGRDRDGHGDLRPPQRHAAHAGRVVGARRGRRAAVRHLAAPLPHQARRPAPPVRPGARPAPDVARRAGRLVDAHQRRLPGDGLDPRPLRGDHRPPRPVRHGRGRDAAQGGRGRRHAPVRADEARRRRRDRAHRARSAAAATPVPPARRCRCRSPRRSPRSAPWPSASRPRSAGEARRPQRGTRRRPRRREAVRPDLARRRRPRAAAVADPPGGPRWHARPVRGRRPAGVPRPRHPPRRVPPRRDEALPGDDLLRGHVDDGRHRRRADAGRRAAA